MEKKKKGSSIAQYTGQALYKKLLESKHFAKKEYKEAFRDAFMSVDKALLEGKKETQEKERKREGNRQEDTLDNNYALDPSGCTAVATLITDDNHIIVVSNKGKNTIASFTK